MHKRNALFRVSSAILVAAVVTGCTMGSSGSSQQPNSGSTGGSATNNDLTVMTNTSILSGLTAKSFDPKNTISSWYGVYHDLWDKQFPKMKINEVQVKDDDAEVTKTLLSVNAGNPPDLIGVHQQLPQLVQRGALENLDKYYNAAGIKPSDFLGPLADYVRYDGHWYGLPGASNPSYNLFYIPAQLKAAGFDPQNVPKTFDQLFAASQKAVKFTANGDLQRVGYPVDTGLNLINLYCGKPTTYDPGPTSSNRPRRASKHILPTTRSSLICTVASRSTRGSWPATPATGPARPRPTCPAARCCSGRTATGQDPSWTTAMTSRGRWLTRRRNTARRPSSPVRFRPRG